MASVMLDLSDALLEKLHEKAQQLDMPLEAVLIEAAEAFVDEDDYEDSDDLIMAELRIAMQELRAGITLSADDVLAALEADSDDYANES